MPRGPFEWSRKTINHQTAIFRQINKNRLHTHHDALEFPDGGTVLLTLLCDGQAATVISCPRNPRPRPRRANRNVSIFWAECWL